MLALKKNRLVDPILTAVVLGYNLDQNFSGHHLFPDVNVKDFAGTIVKFGKEAFIIVDSKVAPGQTIKGVSMEYSGVPYMLNIRKLKAVAPIEEIAASEKIKVVQYKKRAVKLVMQKMRLEGEYDKAQLATTASNYPTGHVETLSGSSVWDDPTADILTQVMDGKSTIRAKIGQEPNVFHLDYAGYLGMKNNESIRKACLPSGKGSITTKMLAEYFEVDNVVVGKSLHLPDMDADFEDIWKDNSTLAYVAPKGQRAKEEPSFGYNYVEDGYPNVGKEYKNENEDAWNNKVYFHDKAILTYPEAGFLFNGTTA